MNKIDNNECGEVYTWGLSLFGRLGYLEGDEAAGTKRGSTDDNRNQAGTNQPPKTYEYKLIPHVVRIPEQIARIACGFDFTAAISVTGKLYTWGTNTNNYLGIDSSYLNSPFVTTPMLVRTLSGKEIIQVVCGSKHMMCLSSEGLVYSWGSGENGVLGHGSMSSYDKPEVIKELKMSYEIVYIAAGMFTSAAISSTGQLFTWGRGKYGVLGLGSEESICIPTLVSNEKIKNEQIFYVSLGLYHSLALSVDKKAFAWGYSEKGRLGCMDKIDCDQKKRVTMPKEITTLNGKNLCQIYAGHYHSFAIAADTRKLYGWGENVDSILGLVGKADDSRFNQGNNPFEKGFKNSSLYYPEELPVNRNLLQISGHGQDMYATYFNFSKNDMQMELSAKSKIKTIACGSTHSLGLTIDGNVFAWGFGENGQLGLKNSIKIAQQPMRVSYNSDKKMKKIYAGYNNSMSISLSGECFIWGDGKSGQLCKHITIADEPSLIEHFSGNEVKKGSLGFNSCAAIVDTRLFTWGCNDNGKLGLDKDDQILFKPEQVKIEQVKSVSCGYEHTAAITQNGDLYTWGRGFYGQLGTGELMSSYEPKRVDNGDSKFVKVKCGLDQTCAVGKKGNVFIWGKSGYNLLGEANQHLKIPVSIDFFKGQRAIKIQTGSGNTFVLLQNMKLYGWGENTNGKVCSDSKMLITGKPKEIKLKGKNWVDIFMGYNHCYGVTNEGEIYGWGTSTCYRLTSDYGDVQGKEPKLLKLSSSQNGGESEEQKHRGGKNKKNQVGERVFLSRLKDKYNIPTYDELILLILNQNQKYEDLKLISIDENYQKILLEKFENNRLLLISKTNINANNFIHLQQILKLRMNAIAPKAQRSLTSMKNPLKNSIECGLDEIQKIYTLFYLHPCLFKNYFLNTSYEAFSRFYSGVLPLFEDLSTYTNKSVNYDIIIYLTFSKLIIKNELESYKRLRDNAIVSAQTDPFDKLIDNLYTKGNSKAEILFEPYFNNYLGRSILFDIFKSTLQLIKDHCLSIIQKIKKDQFNVTVNDYVSRINELFVAQNTTEDDGLGKNKEIEILNKIIHNFLNDLEGNFNMFPPQIPFMLTMMKKKFYKIFIIDDYQIEISKENTPKLKEKIKKALMRLFCKNVLSEKFKEICSDTSAFLQNELGITDNDNIRLLFQSYVLVIGEYIEKIVFNQKFISKKTKVKKEFNVFKVENNKIKELHEKIFSIFTKKFLKDKWEYKSEIIPSLSYTSNSLKMKKIKVSIKNIVDFLGEIHAHLSINNPIISNQEEITKKRKDQSELSLKFQDYIIFSKLFETDNTRKPLEIDMSSKIGFFIDIKFMLDPENFTKNFQKELQIADYDINQSESKMFNIQRCCKCDLLLPRAFILSNPSPYFFKTLEEKAKKYDTATNFLIKINQIIKDKSFPKKGFSLSIKTVQAFVELLKVVIDNKHNTEVKDIARQVKTALEVLIAHETNKVAKEQNDFRVFKIFKSLLFLHLRQQVSHYNMMSKFPKSVNIIDISQGEFIKQINLLNEDIEKNILVAGELTENIDFIDNNKAYKNAKLAEFTFYKKSSKLKKWLPQDNFTYSMVEIPFNKLQEMGVLVLPFQDEFYDHLFQISANTNISIFEMLEVNIKGKDIVKKYGLSFNKFIYYIMNCDSHTIITIPEIGKFNFLKLYGLIHKSINVEKIEILKNVKNNIKESK